jgi:ABC-type sugar transport system substrate-binding protein
MKRFTGSKLRIAGIAAIAVMLVYQGSVMAAPHAATNAAPQSVAQESASPGASGNCTEEYVWVGALSTLPLFQARDFKVLQQHGDELGVCTRVSGPTTFDVPGELAAIEQECAGHPAGVMVLGLDASLGPSIDKCIDEQVPTVTLDVDVPGSKRLSFIGGDFNALGAFIMNHVLADLQRRGVTSGSIALTGALTNPSTVTIIDSAKNTLANSGTNFTYATTEEDQNSADGGAAAEAGILSAYPDLVASIHLNSEAGIGASTAVKEAGKDGKVFVYAGENDIPFAEKVKTGEIAGFFGPRRELHTYYALQALYDFNHPQIVVDGLDKWTAPPIPQFYDVGAIFVDQTNIDAFLSAHQ